MQSAHEHFDDLEALRVIADRLCEWGERRGELMALQLARGDDAPGAESLWRKDYSLMPQGVSLANCRFERGCLVQARVDEGIAPKDPAWLTMRVLHFETSFDFEHSHPFGQLPRLREVSGIREDDLPQLIDRLPSALEVLLCKFGSLENPMLGTHEFSKLHTLGFETLSSPKPALDDLLSQRSAQLTTFWLPAWEYEPLAVQRALARAPGVTVKLFYGDPELQENAAWIAVTHEELELHEHRRHRTGPHFLRSAQELLAASGVTNSTVHVGPKR